MAGAGDLELLEQTPCLLETGEQDEAGQEPSRSHRGRLVAAVCVAGGLALLGRQAYSGQGLKKTKQETTSAVHDLMVKAARSTCVDKEFKDKTGDCCAAWYTSQDRCDEAHNFMNDDNLDASTECCECGGGHRNGGGGEPTTCTDQSPGGQAWSDKAGDDCEAYEANKWCGVASDWPDAMGIDATSACCFCGGGDQGGGGRVRIPDPDHVGGRVRIPDPDHVGAPGGGHGGGGGATCGAKGPLATRRLDVTAKIVNGNDANSCEWKWQIGLRWHDQTDDLGKRYSGRGIGSKMPWCGAQLISEEWVLTAAHCVSDGDTSFELVAGKFETDSDNGNVQTSLVEKVIMHPQYDNVTMNMDFALIKLRTPFTLNDCVGTICLPEEGSDVAAGTQCWISGWGTTETNGNQPEKLQEAEVEIHPQHDCNTKNGGGIMPSMICAQGRNSAGKITDGCQGDSGGPLVCEVQGNWVLFGVTSWGFGCADEAKPGVWARVHEALGWIAETREAIDDDDDYHQEYDEESAEEEAEPRIEYDDDSTP